MPVQVSYPGVYIEEIPSGVRTITGVATSITAFVGRASRGAINEPTTLSSFGDFERAFGGLTAEYPLGYAVRDFYQNGGSTAIIVRLFKQPDTATDASAHFEVDGLTLAAISPGKWGQKLRVTLDVEVSAEVRTQMKLGASDLLFNLTVNDDKTKEKFLNLTVVESPRRIDRVLESGSNLLRWNGPFPTTKPAMANTVTAATKYSALTAAAKDLAAAQGASPPVQATIDAAKATLDAAQQAYNAAKAPLGDPATTAADPTAAEAAALAFKGTEGGDLDNTTYLGNRDAKTGLFSLEKADLFNLLCIPPDSREGDTASPVYQAALTYCQERRAMLIVDTPAAWSANKEAAAANAKKGLTDLGLSGEAARNAALYFPRVLESDPLRDGQSNTFVPCGIVAGVMARTDTTRGVWKAPAGLDASLNGTQGLNVNLTDAESGMLNPLGINCLRFFPVAGRVIWGARTLRGADQLADEYKYVPVRRLALYIEESLFRGTQWVVFEPNDEPLWAQIRLNLGAFMHNLFRQGAFQGQSPKDAYFVKCDKETTPQDQINLGIVNIVVGFAPLKPAEFVVIKLQQMAGQIET